MTCRVLTTSGLLGCALALSCAGPGPVATVAKPPEYIPEGQTKCGVTKSQAHPLVVEWPSADRASLESQRKKGLIVVRYVGCEMSILRQCQTAGTYTYAPITRKDDRITIRDADELYAAVPVYAARLEGKLQKAGELNVTMTIVGTYEADRQAVSVDELVGDCAGATHVVAALTTGAFEFFAGAAVEAAGALDVAGVGAGAKTSSRRELLNRDGDKAECQFSTRDDKEPPEGCGALLRVEVIPVGASKLAAEGDAPVCPEGMSWDGTRCLKQDAPSPANNTSDWMLRDVLLEQMQQGRATTQQLRTLRALCSQLRDKACSGRVDATLEKRGAR